MSTNLEYHFIFCSLYSCISCICVFSVVHCCRFCYALWCDVSTFPSPRDDVLSTVEEESERSLSNEDQSLSSKDSNPGLIIINGQTYLSADVPFLSHKKPHLSRSKLSFKSAPSSVQPLPSLSVSSTDTDVSNSATTLSSNDDVDKRKSVTSVPSIHVPTAKGRRYQIYCCFINLMNQFLLQYQAPKLPFLSYSLWDSSGKLRVNNQLKSAVIISRYRYSLFWATMFWDLFVWSLYHVWCWLHPDWVSLEYFWMTWSYMWLRLKAALPVFTALLPLVQINAITIIIIIIIIMGTFNARHIYPIGYSRRRCGATAALIRQPQTHPRNEEPEIRNRILWEGVRFLACRRKPECPEKTYQGGHGIGKPNSRTTTGKLHWWKTKCSST